MPSHDKTRLEILFVTEKQTNDNEEEARSIAAYLMKPPVHERKIERYDEKEDSVLIRFKYNGQDVLVPKPRTDALLGFGAG